MCFDLDKIERILLNLLSNAVKFSNSGSSIEIVVLDKGETITISVKDNGIGIPEDKLDSIFERFVQVDDSLTRSHEGSGIGLSLVKSLAELHKGSVSVKSTLGKGSEFIVTLPTTLSSTFTKGNCSLTNSNGSKDKINVEFSDI
jgi:signal transduction histidine kinase